MKRHLIIIRALSLDYKYYNVTYTALCVKKPEIFYSFRMFELQRPEWL